MSKLINRYFLSWILCVLPLYAFAKDVTSRGDFSPIVIGNNNVVTIEPVSETGEIILSQFRLEEEAAPFWLSRIAEVGDFIGRADGKFYFSKDLSNQVEMKIFSRSPLWYLPKLRERSFFSDQDLHQFLDLGATEYLESTIFGLHHVNCTKKIYRNGCLQYLKRMRNQLDSKPIGKYLVFDTTVLNVGNKPAVLKSIKIEGSVAYVPGDVAQNPVAIRPLEVSHRYRIDLQDFEVLPYDSSVISGTQEISPTIVVPGNRGLRFQIELADSDTSDNGQIYFVDITFGFSNGNEVSTGYFAFAY